jgi:hypothetical protein
MRDTLPEQLAVGTTGRFLGGCRWDSEDTGDARLHPA